MEVTHGKHIVIIGAGIVGASLAYHLADKGAKVTVIEAGEIASGVTATSFAWINTTCGEPDPIAQLRREAIKEYHRLEAQLPELNIRWTGALSYGVGLDNVLHDPARQLTRAQILALEPNLKQPPQQALYVAQEGALDAVAASRALIAGAQKNGATVLTQTRVLGFQTLHGKVTGIKTSNGLLAADTVVLAAGTGIAALTQTLNLPLPVEASPCIFIRYKAPPDRVQTIISNAAMEIRHTADGALLAAEDYLDDSPENQPAAIALRTAHAIQNELEGVDFLEPELACVGLRPIASDRMPIIGYFPGIDGVYVCTVHPGVALAAIVGRLVSEEIVDGKVSEALAACRPERFCLDTPSA
ncbi:FAD-binding oxidoreductase [Pseudomonas sp. 7P_10.2_Bac1]|uniref:NAD(P)/FAD-dependent oxidoreductase n=1 Tax=Pseudomonas sp. 7P_10.2_Bac1 TaxID=2971614 RepID=UPI0021CA6968|nr:FAD-binding oxidoreductase [Pseudomonas sp. 7P_10.2_Bac1]MCU1726967.1 FAD-binding oxidoreductase [Pseudomonas sp. 7P_10.2_Bac1]